MENNDIYIIGAGTYGEVMCELAQLLGYKVKGFYDDNIQKMNSKVMSIDILGKFSNLDKNEIKNHKFIVAIGNNTVRERIMLEINSFQGETPSLIHPSVNISQSAIVGKGVYIHANVFVWTKVVIEDYCILSPGVVIAHHTNIGTACLISTLTGIGASINIGRRVFIGMGSKVVTGVDIIGENTVIGAGSTLLKNADKNSVYVGTPAKKIKG
ncbi:NeuD/PglB/VioB family sugar acetyltransferase [Planococcus lenghuensis]|uniref:PglD N-terminal domain-containing protein n=1 Tax=Planococcus lenghuensis TaxID=2213202 RepID=A0A1Q2L177_9BACL|nr:NeuD/PglB/VioB family sugar acetyltransferase [Planococcus lenghuensis]AQQ54210.1 hypothetical protein B0X71_14620 [Planococcus lenghuensis]